MCFGILGRFIVKDISKYNFIVSDNEINEEAGWKLVYNDVFRAPHHSRLLSILLGIGTQLGTMSCLVLLLGSLGSLSASHRGKLLVNMMFFIVASSTSGGIIAGTFLKFFKKQTWKNLTIASLVIPVFSFIIYSIIEIINASYHATTAIPFSIFISIFLSWFTFQICLYILGGAIAYKNLDIIVPCSVNQLPRDIPDTTWYNNPYISAILCGIVPFFTVITEIIYIYSSIWKDHVFYLFGFFFISFILLTLGTIMISLLFTYMQLNAGNHQWWWPCFISGASIGLYMFVFSIYYLHHAIKLLLWSSIILYTIYSFTISICFSLYCGFIAVIGSVVFNIFIYKSIRLD